MTLPTVQDALARMLAGTTPLPTEQVPLSDADGRLLAQDVLATRDQPPFDASAMDGWAVRRSDLETADSLLIVGESVAGRRAERAIGPGETVRIFTGAPLPDGADRVIIQEEAERQGDRLMCRATTEGPSYVRSRGCDFRADDTLLEAGMRLNAWKLALAASAGTGQLTCGARPRVAILATGDELVEPGEAAGEDQIYNSATPALAAVAVRNGGRAIALAVAGDDQAAIAEAAGASGFDILVTVGGASVGDHDLVKPAIRDLGAKLLVEGVAMRPGKPVWFAVLPDGRPVLGLPGNPASALVCAELFLVPLLARLQGGETTTRFETARLTRDLAANGPRDHYLRAFAVISEDGRQDVEPFDNQDSSLVTVMAAANALVRREPHAPAIRAGSPVRILRERAS